MIKYRLLIITFITAVLFCFCVSSNKITKLPWYDYYSRNQLDSAKTEFKKYLTRHPKDVTSLSYYAETLRRLKKNISADSLANQILKLDPCNSHALHIKGDIANPQYWRKNPLLNDDSASYYYSKAVECDSAYGEAWKSIWIEAMKRGDSKLEELALIKLYETEFYTKPILSAAQWLLNDLPENAVLLTNGDMDTYPLLVLQTNKNIRTDVTIINVSMLNLKWYFKFVFNRHNIPMGFSSAEFKNLKRVVKEDGKMSKINKPMLKKWDELFLQKKFLRPICFAVTIDTTYLNLFPKRYELQGPYYMLLADTVSRIHNPPAILNSLEKIDPNNFTGPICSQSVTSPIMLNSCFSRRSFDSNFLAIAIHAAIEFSKDSKDSLAYKALDWIDNYLDVVDGKQKHRDMASRFRKNIMNGKYRNQ